MICSQCGTAVDDGLSTCPGCFTPISTPGLFRRLWNALFSQGAGTVQTVIRGEATERIAVPDLITGQQRVFHSMSEVPPDIRAKIEEAWASKRADLSFTYRGPDGKEQTFHSLEEMPPKVRTIYEQVILPEMWRNSGKKG